MAKKSELNERERLFVVAFRGNARGNATKAALAAGYSRKTARSQASRLLTKVNIQRALVAAQERTEKGVIADADERDRVLSEILRSSKHEPTTRIKAAAELNKCSGRHSMTHHLKGKLTLAQAIMESRRPE